MAGIDSKDVTKLTTTPAYENLLTAVEKVKHLTMNTDPHSEFIIAGLIAKDMTAADLSIADIEECIEAHSAELVDYIVRKDELSSDDDIEDEYPPGEEPDPEDEPTDVVELGYCKNFAVANIVEYMVAKRGKAELEAYLKAIRIPAGSVKKYAKKILTEFMPA